MNDSEHLKILNEVRRKVHEGKAFMATLSDGALGTGAVIEAQMVTPVDARVQPHLHPITVYSDGAGVTLEIIENPTVTVGDNPVTKLNRNRRSSNVSDLDVWDNPTAISGGTVLYSQAVPIGQHIVLPEEIILGIDADYIIRLTNDDAGTVSAYMTIPWSE